jgi:dCTP deaminase
MILSQPELRDAVEKGEIKFEPPLEERQWGPASIDLRLGYKFTKWRTTPSARFSLDKGLPEINGLWSEIELNPRDEHGKLETYSLDAGDFILAQVYEKLRIPNNLIALVEGRSRYARTGISIHQTAPWIQPGWSGNITLELRNGPLNISLTPVKDMLCQLTFFRLTSALSDDLLYGSRPTDRFQGQESPLAPSYA